MKTRISILGDTTVDVPKKKIEVVKYKSGGWWTDVPEPSDSEDAELYPFRNLSQWESISLVEKAFSKEGLDLIILRRTDGSPDAFNYFLGHWNDGVI